MDEWRVVVEGSTSGRMWREVHHCSGRDDADRFARGLADRRPPLSWQPKIHRVIVERRTVTPYAEVAIFNGEKPTVAVAQEIEKMHARDLARKDS